MGKVSQNPQFPILEQTVSSAVFSQLRQLWIATAKRVGKNTFLVTEQELLASTNLSIVNKLWNYFIEGGIKNYVYWFEFIADTFSA